MSDRQEQIDAQKEAQASQAATQAGIQASRQKIQKRLENPEFFEQLRDPDVSSDEYPWLEKDIGPAFAGSHIIGQRGPQYEREAKWTNIAEAERVIAEGEPGRLCQDEILQIAQSVHERPDKTTNEPYTTDEKRVVRGAFDVATNFQSLAVESKGLNSVTTATTVAKTEKNESESKSMRERGASFLD